LNVDLIQTKVTRSKTENATGAETPPSEITSGLVEVKDAGLMPAGAPVAG